MLLNTHFHHQLQKTGPVQLLSYDPSSDRITVICSALLIQKQDSQHVDFLGANINLKLRKADLELFIVGAIKALKGSIDVHKIGKMR